MVIQSLDDAHELVDKAISTAISQSKPVYISISCNVAAIPHPNFKSVPLPYSMTQGPDPRKYNTIPTIVCSILLFYV